MKRKVLPLLLAAILFPWSHACAVSKHLNACNPNTQMRFEPNRGQTDDRVYYLARGQGYSAFLSAGNGVLRFHSSHADHVVHMVLAGSNSDPRAAGVDRMPGGEILRKIDRAGIVHAPVLLRHRARVVGGHQGRVEEERPGCIS